MKIPGLIDIHVHVREPGYEHKEDWNTCTQAALAGGITGILAMPNTSPSITNQQTFRLALEKADEKARCDFAQYLGAGSTNAQEVNRLSAQAAGLKMYLDATFGELRMKNMLTWAKHMSTWNAPYPIAVHAEGKTLAAVLLVSHLYGKAIHVCHVSTREEILLIKKAKEKGFQVTCEVTPHHLFLSGDDEKSIGAGRCEVRPKLASKPDQNALWENLSVIDCFATDHAPHLLTEKDSSSPPPGFPGLETALPLLLDAVNAGRLTIEDIILRYHDNPMRIFRLRTQPETWVDIDLHGTTTITGSNLFTKCKWSPFEGRKLKGAIREVHLRGNTVFRDHRILAGKGSGQNFRKTIK